MQQDVLRLLPLPLPNALLPFPTVLLPLPSLSPKSYCPSTPSPPPSSPSLPSTLLPFLLVVTLVVYFTCELKFFVCLHIWGNWLVQRKTKYGTKEVHVIHSMKVLCVGKFLRECIIGNFKVCSGSDVDTAAIVCRGVIVVRITHCQLQGLLRMT